jgi:hypothetical protein
MPMTCQPRPCQDIMQCQDILMHLLYSGGSEQLLRSLITQSVRNITEEYGAAKGVRDTLAHYIPPKQSSLAFLRAMFFVLLDQDSTMRSDLCSKRLLSSLPVVCPHKTCRFFDLLHDSVVVEWVKNESIDLLQFEESLKEAYLVA